MKKAIGIILFVATLLALPTTFFIVGNAGNPDIFMSAYFADLWVFLPVCAIPIASLVFGFVANKGRPIVLKNVIAGAIVTFMMATIGVFAISMDVDRTGAFLEEASSKTGIALPSHVESASYLTTDGKIGNALLKDRTEIIRFNTLVKSDYRWVAKLPVASIGAIPSSVWIELSHSDYYCLYVEPISEFNPMELLAGNYSITLLAYWQSNARLFVLDSCNVSL